jgi:hypothetical protein
MALKTNTTLLAQLPLRQIGGSPGTFRSMWGRGDRMNQSVGQGIPSKLAGIPSGVPHPVAWVMPYKPGRMSSRAAVLTITAAANGTRGLKATGAASFSFDASAVGGLIVNATGSATFSITTNSPFLRATVGGTGAASLSINASAAIGAIANLTGAASFSLSASAPAYAVGHMTGEATSNTPLSPQSLADAVWSAVANTYNASGSMGELLNSAGAAADPLLGTVEGGLTLRDVLRILLAVNAGDATGLEGSTMVFKSQDGTVDRVEATYSSGARTVTSVDPS